MKIPEKGFYYHYKHNSDADLNNCAYEVIGIGRNTEEKTFTVLYRPLYENDWMKPADLQSRPLDMFMDNVTKDGKTFPRFTKITDPKIIEELEKIKNEMYG